MICWLVHDQEIGFFQQQSAQGGARLLPARQLRQRRAIVSRRKSQPAEHPLDARFVFVAAAPFEFRLQLTVDFEIAGGIVSLGHAPLQIRQASFQRSQAGKGFQLLAPKAVFASQFRALRQEGQARSPCLAHCPTGRAVDTGQQIEQGRFASAIGSDEGDARACRNGDADFAEYLIRTVELAQTVGAQNGHDSLARKKPTNRHSIARLRRRDNVRLR